jgi:hypothetical protein
MHEIMLIRDTLGKVVPLLKTMTTTAVLLFRTNNHSLHMISDLKSSFKLLCDIVFGVEVSTEKGSVDISEVIFGSTHVLPEMMKSKDDGPLWLIKAKNLLTTGFGNAVLLSLKAEAEVETRLTVPKKTSSGGFESSSRSGNTTVIYGPL